MSSGSVHGNKDFSQKKQYYMAEIGANIDVLGRVLARQGKTYKYEFYAS
jgi:hypothetical protein